jgi:hypothetical protein
MHFFPRLKMNEIFQGLSETTQLARGLKGNIHQTA